MKKFLLAAATLLFGLGASAQESKNGTYFQEDESWYYMIEDFEGVDTPTGTTSGNETTSISREHKMEGEQALKVVAAAGQYDGNKNYKIHVDLPAGITLSNTNFTHIAFDAYFASGNINHKGTDHEFKVWLNDTNNKIYRVGQGEQLTGHTKNISIDLNDHFTDAESFDLLIGGLCSDGGADGIYYIDNVRLVCNGRPDMGAVTAVALNQTSATIKVGKSIKLNPIFTPASPSNINVSWQSSDERVATIVDGVVTGVAEGNATITVTTEDGGFQATCNVTVTTTLSKNGQVIQGGKYLMLEDFESSEIGEEFVVTNSEGATAKAVVAADPKEVSSKALCYSNSTWKDNMYMKFEFTLPEGKKLSDYKKIAFDLYNGSDHGDNTYKDAKIYIDDTNNEIFSGRLFAGNSSNWEVKDFSLEGKTTEKNTFTLFIGNIQNNGDLAIYIDNIRLEQDTEYAQIGSSDTYWKYDEATTTLTIIGEGPMPDFTGGFWNTPYKYKGSGVDGDNDGGCKMTNLIIGEGITAIGNYCFSDCQQVSNVTFPSTLTRIGDNAFKNCVQLNNLNIPATIEVIGDNAFNMPDWIWTDRTYILKSIPTFGENSFKFEKPEDPEKPEHKATVKLVLDDAEHPFIATSTNMPTIASAEYKRNVTAAYSTICLPFAVENLGGVKVYAMSDNASKESITLTEVSSIEAGKPYVVAKADIDFTVETPTISVATTDVEKGSMKLIGVMQKKELNAEAHAYGLFDGALYLNEGTMTVNPMRAYFKSTATEETPAREMSLLFGGEVTSINNVAAASSDIVEVYNVNGARQPGLAKGINLVKTANGSIVKVIVK